MNDTDTYDSGTRIRQALGDLLDTAPSTPLSPRDLTPFTPEPSHRLAPVLVGALAVAAVAAGGIVIATRSDRPDAGMADAPQTTSAPSATPTLPSPNPVSSVPCHTVGCVPLDRLPVVNGASDFYAGPDELGRPQVAIEYFDLSVRCAQLTADFSACARLEGIGGVNLVTYQPDSSEVTIDTTARSESSFSISVGTTFTEVSAPEYAAQWWPSADIANDGTLVRGHDATRFEHLGAPAVVWQERPGVLVWVAVPPENEADLLDVAEHVRRLDGPSSIPGRVVVTPLAAPWDASNNDGDGVIVASAGGTECVGLDYLDGTCGDEIGQRTIVRHRFEPSDVTEVAGSTPATVVKVRIDTSDGATVSVDTIAFAAFAGRFYSTTIATAETVTVTWLDALGTEIDGTSFTPTRPDAG